MFHVEHWYGIWQMFHVEHWYVSMRMFHVEHWYGCRFTTDLVSADHGC
jgi:hypothetical protein